MTDEPARIWHSPYETPKHSGTTARRVLVWLERRDNPPAMNAPGRLTFGHRIEHSDNPSHWPENGWFFEGYDKEYRVTAWSYADPPDEV